LSESDFFHAKDYSGSIAAILRLRLRISSRVLSNQGLFLGHGDGSVGPAFDGLPDGAQQHVIPEWFVKNSTAPVLMASTVIGTPPQPAMKIIGMSVRSTAMRFAGRDH
jgi:hypothetical protein